MTFLVELTLGNFQDFAEQILEIEKDSFPSPWSSNAFLQDIRNPLAHLWVLASQKRVLGYICYWLYDHEIQLMNLAVHPNWRRRRFGKRLLGKMFDEAERNGATYVSLEVRPSNLGARRFYEVSGFVEVGRRPGYYRDTNEDGIMMAYSRMSKKAAVSC